MTSNTLTDREALYCLCHVPGFGGVTIRGLKDTFGTYLSAWRVKPQELQKSGVLTERRVEVFQESRKHESVWRKEFAGLAQKNIRESTSSAAWQPAWTAMPTEAPSSVESPPTQS